MAIDKKLIDQLLTDYKKPEDIIGENGLLKELTKAILERALQAEMTDHLGYEKHDPAGHHRGNTRNGKSQKTLKGEFGELELETPRDRQATFDPKIVAKGQTRWTGFDDKIISMYARGMTTREIQGHLEEIYGIEVSPTLISNVTDAVIEEVKLWQGRPLEELYPIVYLDALMVKVRDEGHIQNKAIYVVLGVNLEGQKEVLGLWVAQTRRSEVLAAGADGVAEPWGEGHSHRLRGWAERISGSHRGDLSPDRSAALHRASGAGFAELCALENAQAGGRRSAVDLSGGHGGRGRAASCRNWRRSGKPIPASARCGGGTGRASRPFSITRRTFARAIYTTNSVESLNRSLRKIIKTRGGFPNEEAALKLLFLALRQAAKKWTMPIHHWREALNHFTILWPERMPALERVAS